MVEFYLLTFPRFPLRKKEHKSYFGKNRTHDFRTSRCAAHLLDHSGDDYVHTTVFSAVLTHASSHTNVAPRALTNVRGRTAVLAGMMIDFFCFQSGLVT